jgi:hypothetical protein
VRKKRWHSLAGGVLEKTPVTGKIFCTVSEGGAFTSKMTDWEKKQISGQGEKRYKKEEEKTGSRVID